MKNPTTQWQMSFRVLLWILILVGIPADTPAPIVPVCNSLDEALAQSDSVAVIRVFDSRRERKWSRESKERRERNEPIGLEDVFGPLSMGESEDRFVQIVRMLQGDLPIGVECVLRLPPLSRATLPGHYEGKVFIVDWPGDREGDVETTQVLHLVFLRKTLNVTATDGEELPALASGLDCLEGNIPLHPQTNLDVLSDAGLKERITVLAEDSKRLYIGTNGEESAGCYVNWCLGKPYRIWRKAPGPEAETERP